MIKGRELDKDLIADVGRTACFTLGPVAAILGGMWGREAIKSLSRRDDPVENFFFFSSRTSQGTVERVGGRVVPKNVVKQVEVVEKATVIASE